MNFVLPKCLLRSGIVVRKITTTSQRELVTFFGSVCSSRAQVLVLPFNFWESFVSCLAIVLYSLHGLPKEEYSNKWKQGYSHSLSSDRIVFDHTNSLLMDGNCAGAIAVCSVSRAGWMKIYHYFKLLLFSIRSSIPYLSPLQKCQSVAGLGPPQKTANLNRHTLFHFQLGIL